MMRLLSSDDNESIIKTNHFAFLTKVDVGSLNYDFIV